LRNLHEVAASLQCPYKTVSSALKSDRSGSLSSYPNQNLMEEFVIGTFRT